MAGRKTHEQRIRTFEKKPGIDDPAVPEEAGPVRGGGVEAKFRKTEHRISRGGLNQEDRRHNKPAPEREGGEDGQG